MLTARIAVEAMRGQCGCVKPKEGREVRMVWRALVAGRALLDECFPGLCRPRCRQRCGRALESVRGHCPTWSQRHTPSN